MPELTYLEAIRQGIWEEMERDPAVILLGEDIAAYGGAYNDPKLEASIGNTVDKLVAASDRPGPASPDPATIARCPSPSPPSAPPMRRT